MSQRLLAHLNGGLAEIVEPLMLTEVATPAAPPAGTVAIYPKADHKFYFELPDGTETALT